LLVSCREKYFEGFVMIRSFATLALVAAAVPAQAAAPVVDHVALDRAIQSFTGSAIGAPGGATAPVDRRLRLSSCAGDVRLAWRSPRRDTVILECPMGTGWKLFVPVVPTNAVMAVAPQTRSEIGATAIAKGDMVTVEVRGTGFSISQGGQAMEAGPVGSWIKIKSGGKGEVITCQIVRPGLVSLPTS
jgi:flagellar basal body P-ring formation protein FlgA